jgi:hypothetical protein
MTWHTAIVPAAGLSSLLSRVRAVGGTVACSVPGTDGVRVTWTVTSADADADSVTAWPADRW